MHMYKQPELLFYGNKGQVQNNLYALYTGSVHKISYTNDYCHHTFLYDPQ